MDFKMSDEKLPTKTEDILPTAPTTDIGEGDMKRLVAFVEEGMPGIIALTPEKIDKGYELYRDGANYSSVSMDLHLKKEMVLWAAHKGDWFTKRLMHLEDMANKFAQDRNATKLSNKTALKLAVDHKRRIMLNLLSFFNLHGDIGTKIELDQAIIEFAKIEEQYNKSVGNDEVQAAKPSPVSVHVGGNSSVTIKDNQSGKSMDITPNVKGGQSLRARIAEEERAEEERKNNEKLVDASDIKEDNE
jgi:hypothetical protein